MNTSDPLDHDQQVRAACVHEAGRVLMAEDPFVEDLLAVAEYILTGNRGVAPRALSRREVSELAAQTGKDAAVWMAPHELPDNFGGGTP